MKETLPLDVRGHLFSREPIATVEVLRDLEHTGDLILGEAAMSYSCDMCGAWRDLKIVGDKVQQPEPCPCPDGITTTITLAVPSGRIVVYDDLRETYPMPGNEGEFASYNSALGQHQVIEAYAAVGLAYGPVGNSCPGLYRTGEGHYVIASPDYDDESGERIVPPRWSYQTGIITDLCAYSIADEADYLAKGGRYNTGRIYGPDVVEVPPGTYRFTHHTGEKNFDHYAPSTVIFAHIERITGS